MKAPVDLTNEFVERAENGHVGNTLLSETDRVRVWHIRAKPGERLKVHTHQLDYFWTILGSGRARNYQPDGTHYEVEYAAGDIKHMSYAKGERMTHSLENIGETDLVFTTVEFLDSANPPLPLEDKNT